MFYLKARATMRGDSDIQKAYFELLADEELADNLIAVIEELKAKSKANFIW